MLGRLAKQLRMLGFDTEYMPVAGRSLEKLMRKAADEGRRIITRDTLILQKQEKVPFTQIPQLRVLDKRDNGGSS